MLYRIREGIRCMLAAAVNDRGAGKTSAELNEKKGRTLQEAQGCIPIGDTKSGWLTHTRRISS